MRFSICVDPSRPWDEIVAIATHADATGWDGLYVCDHFMRSDSMGRPVDVGILEGWTALAALAGHTRRLRLGTLVLGNTYRHPAVVANMAATMDHVTGGRFVLGIGAGWAAGEHEAYGIELAPPRTRIDRLEESCAVITSLLHEPRTTISGPTYRLAGARCDPKPLQAHLPLLIGGGGERRTLRVVARYADEWHVWATSADELRHKSRVLDRHCHEVGRDPTGIRRATGGAVLVARDGADIERLAVMHDPATVIGTTDMLVDHLADHHRAGVDEFIWRDDWRDPCTETLETLLSLSTDVWPRVP